MIRTVNTDGLAILIGIYHLTDKYPGADIWVAFGADGVFQHCHIYTVSGHPGRDKCKATLAFHAVTGCDTCLSF